MSGNGYISASGAIAEMGDLDVVSNNLANVGTPGFKRSVSIFRAVLEASLRDAAGQLQPGATSSSFVATDRVGTDFEMGSAQHTGSPLNVVIEGRGFFEIDTSAGLRYARAGNFIVNSTGQLALPNGDPVMGAAGAIDIPDGSAHIVPTGVILDSNGDVLGRLQVHDFEDPQSLEREGQSLYRPAEGSVSSVVEAARFIPGSVEGSNVQTARELATMVLIQRAFETNLRAMQVDDESTQRLIEGMSK